MKVFDYVEEEKRADFDRDWYSVDADLMYPDAVAYTRSLVEGGDVPMYLQQHIAGLQAAGIDSASWDSALQSAEGLSPEQRARREQVLESARLVFTSLLREQAGGPVGLHITRGKEPDRWKL